MTLATTQIEREFHWNGLVLADPNPQMPAESVRGLYAETYPDLVNAAVEGPQFQNGREIWTFKRGVGTKG